MECITKDKHSSLLGFFVGDDEKSFTTFGARSSEEGSPALPGVPATNFFSLVFLTTGNRLVCLSLRSVLAQV